jgi:hypothetical protein
MATVQVTDGVSAVTATSKKNNGGTIANAGNADTTSGPISKVMQLNTLAGEHTQLGSLVVAKDGTGSQYTDRIGVAKAVSTGTLAYKASSSEWIIYGQTSTIGGVSNTVLATAGADYNGAMVGQTFPTISDRKKGTTPIINILAVPSSGLNSYITKGAGAGNINTYINPMDGTDAVASEVVGTLSVPGELTYQFGSTVPKMDYYKAKDSYESF